MLEQLLRTWLIDRIAGPIFYQHLDKKPGDTFVWFLRNGDDTEESLDDHDGEPDIVYFDVEAYSDSVGTLQEICAKLRGVNGYRGKLGETGETYVDDIECRDQSDDYQPRATAESLPAYSASFRLAVTGFGEF